MSRKKQWQLAAAAPALSHTQEKRIFFISRITKQVRSAPINHASKLDDTLLERKASLTSEGQVVQIVDAVVVRAFVLLKGLKHLAKKGHLVTSS
jgi:hypothetical protein